MMKKFKIQILAAVFVALLVRLFLNESAVSIKAQEAFTIDSYHVALIVEEDGVIDVEETMSVQFDAARHGIYVNLSEEYEMDFEGNGIRQRIVFPITDLKVESAHEFTIERENEGVQIRLGSESQLAQQNETYQWSYKLHTHDLELGDFQMLFMNLIGRWDTTIDQFSFEIVMPKEFDTADLRFDAGPYWVEWNQEDCRITGKIVDTIMPNQSVTVFLPLPADYFVFPDYSSGFIAIALGTLGLAALIFLLFLKVGRDAPVIVSVQFKAPEQVSSAEIGYIIDGSVEDRDIVSLLLDWAGKGYLRIEDREDELYFVKLNELDESFEDYERRMFDELFEKGNEVSTAQLREHFYSSITACKQALMKRMKKPQYRIFTRDSLVFQGIVELLAVIPTVVILTYAWWVLRFNAMGLIISLFPLVPLVTLMFLLVVMENGRYGFSLRKKRTYQIFCVFLGLFYLVIMAVAAGYAQVPWLAAGIVSLGTLVLCVLGQRMSRRTERGTRLLGEVAGLRQFIEIAEQDRLKMLVEENPMLFYDILPYAYAFGLVEIWTEHFKDLVIPEADWYYAADPQLHGYYLVRSLNRSLVYAQSAMVAVPPPKTQGGGFGSGGFGSGGFSGGGFGGSSGGSW